MRRTITAAAVSGLLLLAAGCSSDDAGVTAAESGDRDSVPASASPATGAPADTAAGTDPTASATDDTTGTEDTDTELTLPDLSIPDLSIPDLSIPGLSIPDITFPDLSEITVPEGLSPECTELYTLFTTAFSTIMVGGDEGQEAAQRLSDELVDRVPAELDDDAAVVADAFGTMADVLARYDGDMTRVFSDPEALADLEVLSSPEFTAASDRLTEYFETECPFD